jgi:hypothetical protein
VKKVQLDKASDYRKGAVGRIRSLDDWCREFERTLTSLFNASIAAEQTARYRDHFWDMLQKEVQAGTGINEAKERVLAAVLSREEDPASAAKRHHQGSTTHWRFLAARSEQFLSACNASRPSRGQRKRFADDETDRLIACLLKEFRIPFLSNPQLRSRYLADLRYLLKADYCGVVSRLQNGSLLRKLSTISENIVRPALSLSLGVKSASRKMTWENLEALEPLKTIFRADDLTFRAARFRGPQGLALRGFYCRTVLGGRRKSIIYVNTAHARGAVAAAFAHELGHHLVGSLGKRGRPVAAFGSQFRDHLSDVDEILADSFVALSMYPRDLIQKIGSADRVVPGNSDEFVRRVRKARRLMPPPYGRGLFNRKRDRFLRLGHLAEMVHFLRLRSAIYTCLGL